MTRLEDEIRAALLPGKATDDERAAWVRDALGRTPPRRRLHVMWPILAAAAVLVAVFWPRTKPVPAPPVVQAQEQGDEPDEAGKRLLTTTVAEQRARNLAFLAKSRTLKDARKGNWVIVTGGDSLHVAKTIEDAIAWADKLYPEAKHRFLFQTGDVIGDRGPVALATAGLFFFEQAGIKPDDDRLQKVNGKYVAFDLEVNGKPMRIRLDRESLGTLILPAGVHFALAEIPGRHILEDLDRNWRSFRRYLVRVRHVGLGLDAWVEAAGAESAERYAPGHWLAVRYGGQVFHALRKDPGEQAVEEGKPIVVLHIAEGSSEYLNRLFGKVDVGRHGQYAVPQAKRTEVRRYDTKGKLTASLALPDASEATTKALRKVLR